MNDIIDNINNVLNKIYKSIQSRGLVVLDNLSNINIEIFSKEPLKSICSEEGIAYISLLIKACIFGFILYYILKTVLTLYSSKYIENIYYFCIKVIIITIVSANAYKICQYVVDFNSLLTDTVESLLSNFTDLQINYESLKETSSTIDEFFESENILSANGFGEYVICFFMLHMLIIFAVRYVTLILCVLISPFCILMLLSIDTSKVFFAWTRTFIFNLIVQILNKFVIFIPIVSKQDELFIFIYIGSIILLYKINSQILELYEKNK